MEPRCDETVLFLTSRLPFPPADGRKISLNNYCKFIAKDMGFKLILVTFGNKYPPKEDIPLYVSDIILIPVPPMAGAVIRWIIGRIFNASTPLQSELFWSRKNQKKIERILDEHRVTTVIADMVRTGEYLLRSPNVCKKVADLDDLLSVRYSRQLSSASHSSPIGTAGAVGKIGFFNRILTRTGLIKLLVSAEAKLLESYEQKLALSSDSVVLVSPVEAELLQHRCPESRIHTIPVSVDEALLDLAITQNPKHVITFLGALNVPHNSEGLIRFIHEIWPIIKKRDAEVTLQIVGRGENSDLSYLAHADPRIRLIGEVNDFVPYLQKSKALIAPMWFGSGIKTKILESMAVGIPVITTPIGAEGIGGIPGTHYFVAETVEQFSDSVMLVLNNSSIRADVSRNGRALVGEKFTYNRVMQTWYDVLGGK
ncbi:glycosyltransferase [Alicyclobacillus curvatus]|nr:glycosyltransferase [Alicyclobacillus curvatus]